MRDLQLQADQLEADLNALGCVVVDLITHFTHAGVPRITRDQAAKLLARLAPRRYESGPYLDTAETAKDPEPTGSKPIIDTAIPRRTDVRRMMTEEHMIRACVLRIEQMAADPRLTDAVVLLQAARDSFADYIDGVKTRRHVVEHTSDGQPIGVYAGYAAHPDRRDDVPPELRGRC